MVLYRQILGQTFDALPAKVQALHDSADTRVWRGEVVVTSGVWWLRPFAWGFGFPSRGGAGPIEVTFTPDSHGEQWQRDFFGHILRSHQSHAADMRMVERFGPASVTVRFEIRADRLYLIPETGHLFGLPIPRLLLPKGTSFETAEDDRFRFDVEVALPILGRIVHYAGWLLPAEPLR